MVSTRPVGSVHVLSLEKSFGEWPVLWNLDLSVPWGETFVLFGANGAGKSTLLRVLSTHIRADRGSIVVADRDVRTNPEEVRRRIGVVGHRSLLYDDLTCRENLTYYGRLYGIENNKLRVDEVLKIVRLSDRSEHRVRTLSNGMQKRAAIARAILHQPDVLLLDEPEVGLDRESVSILGSLLQDWTNYGRSVVMTTHDLDLGLSWGQRIGVLQGGKIHLPNTGSTDYHRVRQTLSKLLEGK